MYVALIRNVPGSINSCQLTHLGRETIDLRKARAQHRLYEAALTLLGCKVRRLADADDLPDSVFVEDTAVVLDETAVITRPGAPSRRAEVASTALVLGEYRKLHYIQPPGILDGGDVLAVGKRVYVGVSSRSNEEGIHQLESHLRDFGYEVVALRPHGCLHLKSAVTALRDDLLLINPMWLSRSGFKDAAFIEVDPTEPYAANVLRVGDDILCPSEFPRTAERIREAGLQVHTVEAGELAKAEGAVTCCSLVFRTTDEA